MITKNTIFPFGFYKYKKPFTGSLNGQRYRIIYFEEKYYPDNLSDDISEEEKEKSIIIDKFFKLWIWPEPFSFEKTDPSVMTTELFPFDEEGYEALIAYLNEHLV